MPKKKKPNKLDLLLNQPPVGQGLALRSEPEPLACNNCYDDKAPLFIAACDACYAKYPRETVRCEECIAEFKRLGMEMVCCKCEKKVSVSRQWSFGWTWLPDKFVLSRSRPPFEIIPFYFFTAINISSMVCIMVIHHVNEFYFYKFVYVCLMHLCILMHVIDMGVQVWNHCFVRLNHWVIMMVCSIIHAIFSFFIIVSYETYVFYEPDVNLYPYMLMGGVLLFYEAMEILYYARLMYQNGLFSKIARAAMPVKSEDQFRPVRASSDR